MVLNRHLSTASIAKPAGPVSPDIMVIFPTEGKERGRIFVNRQPNASNRDQLEKLWVMVLLGPSFDC